MKNVSASSESGPSTSARILVLSMFFAPCAEVGGKRFSYLSKYLSERSADYHVLARREKITFKDSTAFRGNVHRVIAFPHLPPRGKKGIRRILARIWAQWLSPVDRHIGWVIPATIRGVRLCNRNQLNIVIVTVPYFSALIAAAMISRITSSMLIIDYRDEWTNYRSNSFSRFGKLLYPRIERAVIRRASAVVLCTDIMKEDFSAAFSTIAPEHVEVIYNGFEYYEGKAADLLPTGLVNMVYAGNFHGKRRLAVIAPVLAAMRATKKISADSFRFHLYSKLSLEDQLTISRFDIGDIVEVHKPVPYDTIKKIMKASDILFLPSGEEVRYAVPFKFFDYLSTKRPILAVASKRSTVNRLMQTIDCGEFAEFGDMADIERALTVLLRHEKQYSYSGSERYTWTEAANSYHNLLKQLT